MQHTSRLFFIDISVLKSGTSWTVYWLCEKTFFTGNDRVPIKNSTCSHSIYILWCLNIPGSATLYKKDITIQNNAWLHSWDMFNWFIINLYRHIKLYISIFWTKFSHMCLKSGGGCWAAKVSIINKVLQIKGM